MKYFGSTSSIPTSIVKKMEEAATSLEVCMSVINEMYRNSKESAHGPKGLVSKTHEMRVVGV